MEDKSSALKHIILHELERRIVQEFIPKIKDCINLLPEETLSQRPNENCNSIGNLILHLNGNVRQWIMSGAAGLTDHRNREEEFKARSEFDKNSLEAILDQLANDLNAVIPEIAEKPFTQVRKVQCYEENIISILIHAIEHFSYHTGQIVYITKALTNKDLAFYAGNNLNDVN